jgi:hypothetical protein
MPSVAAFVGFSIVISAVSGCTTTTEREIVTTRNPSVQHEVADPRAPMPAPLVEMRTISPDPSYRWVDGRHQWNGRGWEWSPGFWAP